ncbi:uncharacterized protein LOC124596475 [Schistocerca americana]|uniref:uncharacterized protein LOC124596475 n=1 Tax=Schistocerca americana TaxID=7009 RepID=UPI001F4F3AFF|nr:uncharacterized protein LOC124596475 [Schistocerca americana]
MDGLWVLLHVSAFSLLLLLVATVPASSHTSTCRVQDCPNYRTIHYYEDLGCVRSDGSSECCPTRFDCSSLLSLDKTKCHLDGKAYEDGAWNDGSTSECTPGCVCQSHEEGPWKGDAHWACLPPGFVQYLLPEGKESVCYPSFRVDQDCFAGIICANDTKSLRNVTECTYEGKTFLEGQVIDGTVSECQRCVCQKGYDGTLKGPWCSRPSCGYRLTWPISQLRTCAPLYSEENKCCTYEFHCPSAEDFVVRRYESSTANEGDQCSFGDHKLKIGDELLSTGGKCIKCSCDIPPFITCEKLPDSYCPTTKK